MVIITCHIFTCAFYFIGVETNGFEDWTNMGDIDQYPDVFDRYVAGFYWAIMTTTTIGMQTPTLLLLLLLPCLAAIFIFLLFFPVFLSFPFSSS